MRIKTENSINCNYFQINEYAKFYLEIIKTRYILVGGVCFTMLHIRNYV